MINFWRRSHSRWMLFCHFSFTATIASSHRKYTIRIHTATATIFLAADKHLSQCSCRRIGYSCIDLIIKSTVT